MKRETYFATTERNDPGPTTGRERTLNAGSFYSAVVPLSIGRVDVDLDPRAKGLSGSECSVGPSKLP